MATQFKIELVVTVEDGVIEDPKEKTFILGNIVSDLIEDCDNGIVVDKIDTVELNEEGKPI